MAARLRAGALVLGLVLVLPGVGSLERAVAQPSADRSEVSRSDVGSDFDGDGYDDLAVPTDYSYEDDAVTAIVVRYGSPDGLVTNRRQRLVAAQLFPRRSGERVGFDHAMASGDFDGDGYDDLAVGADNSTIGGRPAAGAVVVVYGSTSGLDPSRRRLLTQNTPGVPGKAETEDRFGGSLTVGDFGRGSEDDLAIGSPEEGVNDRYQNGVVHVLYGSRKGLDPATSQVWRQNTPGIAGRVGDSDAFGSILAAGNLGGSHHDDLAIASPSDHFHERWEHGNGTVHVLYGSADGLSSRDAERFSEEGPGIDRAVGREGGGFARALAIGHFRGGPYADLAVASSYGPNPESYTDGSVTVWFGSAGGLTRRHQVWSEASYGIAGRPADDDHFGQPMAVGNFGHDLDGVRFDDLALGVARTTGGRDGAAVHVIYGGPWGLTGASSQYFRHGSYPRLAAGNYGRNRTRVFDDLAVTAEGGDPRPVYGSQGGLRR